MFTGERRHSIHIICGAIEEGHEGGKYAFISSWSGHGLIFWFLLLWEDASVGFNISCFCCTLHATLVAEEPQPKLRFLLYIRCELVLKSDVLVSDIGVTKAQNPKYNFGLILPVRQRVYCEDNLPAGVLRDHAIRSAEFTRDFFQAFVGHIEDEITMLTSFGLGEAQVMLLMSNQLMQICDDLFDFRHAAINVDASNRAETSARYAWVTLQALGKMTEYLKMKFKHHPSITGTFVRFLTRQTAETSTSGLKARVDALESTVKSLKTKVEALPSKKDLDAVHNKIDLIVSANDLKKK